MTPQDFIAKWRDVELKERSASQSHFNDLCALLGVLDPVSADKTGDSFTFEKGASKSSGGEGWADVWKKDCFAWEYKGKRKDLDAALTQLRQYTLALDNPPLLIVSDMEQIHIHTNWTNTVHKTHVIKLEDLTDGATRDKLRYAFTDAERLKPEKTRQLLTEEAAQKFAKIAQRLRERGHNAEAVAHFVNRLVFCMFAEDVNLLPNKMFERLLQHCLHKPLDFELHAKTLFGAMKQGGMVGFERVEWFNGGLFDSDDAFPLLKPDVEDLIEAAKLDWSDIDPSILGTLFERGLDPSKRSQLGAHYTDRAKIMQIVNPVIVEPLLAEWAGVKAEIGAALEKAAQAKSAAAKTKASNEANQLRVAFMEKLRAFRVLDPACGSGNFLYLSLLELKNIEHKVSLEAEALGFPREFPAIGPEAVLGIELNSYAAELARVSVWIGEIQWMRRNGFEAARNPILRTLNTIENRDAIMNADGTRAEWPKADVVVGNPPFLGNKKMNKELGSKYSGDVRLAFSPDLSGTVDLVAYWFHLALHQLKLGNISRVGLVATESIRQPKNIQVLEQIQREAHFFNVWPNEPWVVDGANVRVSLVCFTKLKPSSVSFEGRSVANVEADLTVANGFQSQTVHQLSENRRCCFEGFALAGPFDITRELAERFLLAPTNPNGRKNHEVIKKIANGRDLIQRSSDRFLVDFNQMLFEEACLFEMPFKYVEQYVKPMRLANNRKSRRDSWWIYGEARPGLRKATLGKFRTIAILKTSKHRLAKWCDKSFFCDGNVNVVTRDDDTTFGILHSRFHELWSLRMGTSLEDRPRYTPSTTFETFPFPEGLTPNIKAADYAADPRAITIAAAAARLNELRETWLNPPDLVKRVPEVVPGYPDRILPIDEKAEAILKKRTLTNLYNQRPAWLDNAHKALDEAVADAYGWGDDWRAGKLTEDEILARLFQLNQERAAAQ